MMRSAKVVLFAGAIILFGAAQADPIVWKGGVDSSWNTAKNWSPATVPNGSGVEADLSAASGTINISSAVTVGSVLYSPGVAKTLTLAGQRLTFAAAGTPTVTVGIGGTLLTTCNLGGTQGLKKLGVGAFNPKAYNASGMFSGTFDIAEGTSAPVKNGSDGYPGNPIKIEKGTTLTLTGSDMYGPWQSFEIAGGTFAIGGNGDYVNGITFSNGGMITTGTGGHIIQDAMLTPQLNAKGDGFAGLYDGIFWINSCFIGPNSSYQSNNIRTQNINVANMGATFAMTKYIYEGRASAAVNGDIYMREWRGTAGYPYRAQIDKIGNGDLLLYDNTVTVDGATTVKAGRIVLSNSVNMAVTKVVAPTTDALVIRKGAVVKLGGIDIASGALDLGGGNVEIGGPNNQSATFGGSLANGTVAKVGCSEQTLAPGQTQQSWDIYGGTLGFGVPTPVVRYDFDSAETLGRDTGRAGRHLTASNNVAWAADGVRGGCAKFSGNGCLTCAAATGLPGGNSAHTIALWMKSSNVGGKRALVGWGEFGKGAACTGFNYMHPSLFHAFWEGSVDYTSSPLANDIRGAWHHVAFTYEPISGTRAFYLDGKFVSSQVNQVVRNLNTAKPFSIGGNFLYSTDYDGEMDEVMVFDKTLSEAQIAALAQSADIPSRAAAFGANGTVRLSRDATLAIGGANQTVGAFAGRGKLALGDAEVTLAGAADSTLASVVGKGTLTKAGAGNLTLEDATATGGKIVVERGTLTAKGQCADAALRSHLVAWWNFNDPDDPGKDASGNGLTLGPWRQKDNNVEHDSWDWRNHFTKLGGAAYFDGNNASNRTLRLRATDKIGLLPHGNSSMTYALWIKPDATCAGNGVFIHFGGHTSHKANGFRFYENGGKRYLRHYFWSNDCSSSDLPGDILTGDEFTGWHHVAYTFDAATGEQRFYLDGRQAGDAVKSGHTPDVATDELLIGWGYNADRYRGYMDDIMVFDKTLTAEEVRAVSRGFADAPNGGAEVVTAAGTTLSVAAGTVGLSGVSGDGAVNVADGATLALAGGESAIAGALSGTGRIAVAHGAKLAFAQDFGGQVSVADGALALTAGAGTALQTLTLAEGARIAVETAQSPATAALVVADEVALPTAATVAISIPAKCTGVRVPLVKCVGGHVGSVAGWTVEVTGGGRHWTSGVEIVGDTIYAEAQAPGLSIIIR